MAEGIVPNSLPPFLLAGKRMPANLSWSGSGLGAGRKTPGRPGEEVNTSLWGMPLLLDVGLNLLAVVVTGDGGKLPPFLQFLP